jgi:putative phage-type endonuclease
MSESTSTLSNASSIKSCTLSFIETLNGDEITELVSTIYELVDEYLDNNILQMSNPSFHTNLINTIIETLLTDWEDANIHDFSTEEDGSAKSVLNYDMLELRDFIESRMDEYFEMGITKPRSYKNAAIINRPDYNQIREQISILQAIEQPEQRTPAWYEFRHGLISASNLYKCLGSEAQQNSIIYEKCKPMDPNQGDTTGYVNTESPMHWGQKYEPVSVKFYERLFNTKVGEFGCIRHSIYPFIGASPDGINICPESDRYGRVIEIKNVVNRELNGIPKLEYWVQMQIQMETCNLDECDFMETVFKEYPGEEEFYKDENMKLDDRGVMLYFVQRISMGDISSLSNVITVPKYEYMPMNIGLDKESVDAWIDETRIRLRRNWSLYQTIYWYLDDYSCVMVPRNRDWFQAAVPKIQDIWNTILKERVDGYDHRAAKKKVSVKMTTDSSDSYVIKNMPISNSVCLVKLE